MASWEKVTCYLFQCHQVFTSASLSLTSAKSSGNKKRIGISMHHKSCQNTILLPLTNLMDKPHQKPLWKAKLPSRIPTCARCSRKYTITVKYSKLAWNILLSHNQHYNLSFLIKSMRIVFFLFWKIKWDKISRSIPPQHFTKNYLMKANCINNNKRLYTHAIYSSLTNRANIHSQYIWKLQTCST